MVNIDGVGSTLTSEGLQLNPDNLKSNIISQEYKLTDLSSYFVKDILKVLEDTDKKGKTKLKEIRRKMYGFLKKI